MLKSKICLLCNIILFCTPVLSASAKTITFSVDHNMSAPAGYRVCSILNVWPPYSDQDVYDLGQDTEISMDFDAPGIYVFSAQWVIYNADGSVAVYSDGTQAISDESEFVFYEIFEDSVPSDDNADSIPSYPDVDEVKTPTAPISLSPPDSASRFSTAYIGYPAACFLNTISTDPNNPDF